MNYELRSGEKLSRGIRRIAKRQADRVLKRLAQKRPHRDGRTIHEARKDLKKLRAALRLVRARMGGRVCRKEDRKFRDAGRALAPLRDSEALVKTLEQLRCCYHGRTARQAFAHLRKALRRRRGTLLRRALDGCAETRANLLDARQRIKHWPLDGLKWSDIRRGIRRTYKRGVKAFREVETKPSPELIHKWRKRTKELWQYLCILKQIQPEAMAALANQLKLLTEYLGDDHDLAMLEGAAAISGLSAEELELIGRPIADRRVKLRRAALDLGRKLYVQKPGVFARRIEHYAKAWHR
jgi:CHAD domain-containing protein